METGNVSKDGKWASRSLAVVHYDVPVDRQQFEPPATKPAATFDAAAWLAKDASPEDALARCEALGMILAVHEVRRADDGTLLVRSSIRPTAETLKQFGGGGLGAHPIGDFFLDSPDPSRFSVVPVAEYMSGRLLVKWDLLVPLSPPKDGPPASVKLLAGVRAQDFDFMDSFERQKQPDYVNDVEVGAVAIPAAAAERASVDELIASVWTTCKSMHSIFTPVDMSEATRLHPNGKRSMKSTRMDNWTAERLASEVKLEIRQRREGDIQRQRAIRNRD
jgi:hypothetical protein